MGSCWPKEKTTPKVNVSGPSNKLKTRRIFLTFLSETKRLRFFQRQFLLLPSNPVIYQYTTFRHAYLEYFVFEKKEDSFEGLKKCQYRLTIQSEAEETSMLDRLQNEVAERYLFLEGSEEWKQKKKEQYQGMRIFSLEDFLAQPFAQFEQLVFLFEVKFLQYLEPNKIVIPCHEMMIPAFNQSLRDV